MAWPGGVILNPNKTEALAAFLARRDETLSEDQQYRLRVEIQSADKNKAIQLKAATTPFSAQAGADDMSDDTEMTNREEEPQTVTSSTPPTGAPASTTPGKTTNHTCDERLTG